MRKQKRKPHPDPAIELQLQEILELRASVGRWAELIRGYRISIESFHIEMRRSTMDWRIEAYAERADALDGKIHAAEASITGVHEQIRDRTAKIDPADLAYL